MAHVQETVPKTATANHNKVKSVMVLEQTAKTNAELDLDTDAVLECNEAADKYPQKPAFPFLYIFLCSNWSGMF